MAIAKLFSKILLSAVGLLPFVGNGQHLPTEEDYQRAQLFYRDNIRKHVFNMIEQIQWFGDKTGFAYKVNTENGERYFVVTTKDAAKEPAFDRKRFADNLGALLNRSVHADSLPISNLNWDNRNSFSFSAYGTRCTVSLDNYEMKKAENNFRRRDISVSTSPDGKYEVRINQSNLYLKDVQSGTEIRLSDDGSPTYIYGSYYEWSQIMEGEGTPPEPNLTVQWAPGNQKFLTQIMDARDANKMYLLNWSVDTLYRPVLLSYYRGSPGDTNIVKYLPVIFDIKTGRMVKIELPPVPHFMGMDLQWSGDGKHLYGIYRHRGFQKIEVVEVDAETGKVRSVYADSSKTNIENNVEFRYLENKNMAFITSEKSGWNQIYGFDWSSGKTRRITDGEFVVKEIVFIDTIKNNIYFTAAGKEAGVNPYFDLFYGVGFDGKNQKLLTPEKLNHEIKISPDGKYFVDFISSAENPTAVYLRELNTGKKLLKADSADIHKLTGYGWRYPETFTATGKDGKTTIYGVMYKPSHFNPAYRYPVMDASYTGPHMFVYPNTFLKALNSQYYHSAQGLAELGFIVVHIDGLGSAGRSKSFHDWSYKNMGDNLHDHVLFIRQMGERYSWFDAKWVGIFGHSAGGYDAARALIAFNDCYKAAVSESADHDWRMEKAWWPEMYAGWPVDSVYSLQSNVTNAAKLKGNLLLIHGGIDENVNPSATFKLSEALIKAGKDFDLLIIPSARHGYPLEYWDYVRMKTWKFFVKHLIEEPGKAGE